MFSWKKKEKYFPNTLSNLEQCLSDFHFQALQSNPKIKVVMEDGVEKFLFKPKYEINNRKALLNLLKRHDLHGDGGILLEDVEESCPNAQKALKV